MTEVCGQPGKMAKIRPAKHCRAWGKIDAPHEIFRCAPWSMLPSRRLFKNSMLMYGTSTTSRPFPRCFSQTSRSEDLSVNVKPGIPSLLSTSISYIRPLALTNVTFLTWLQKTSSVLPECGFQEYTAATFLASNQLRKSSSGRAQRSFPSGTDGSLTYGSSAMCMACYSCWNRTASNPENSRLGSFRVAQAIRFCTNFGSALTAACPTDHSPLTAAFPAILCHSQLPESVRPLST